MLGGTFADFPGNFVVESRLDEASDMKRSPSNSLNRLGESEDQKPESKSLKSVDKDLFGTLEFKKVSPGRSKGVDIVDNIGLLSDGSWPF